MSIAGHWTGFYTYTWPEMPDVATQKRYRHEAWFTLKGQSLTGKVKDIDRVRDVPLAAMLQTAQWDAEGRSVAEEWLAEEPTLRVLSTLPEHSVIEGTFVDGRVNFVLRYLADTRVDWKVGDTVMASGWESNLPVIYSGELVSGSVIRGTWIIKDKGKGLFAEKVVGTGLFEFRTAQPSA